MEDINAKNFYLNVSLCLVSLDRWGCKSEGICKKTIEASIKLGNNLGH